MSREVRHTEYRPDEARVLEPFLVTLLDRVYYRNNGPIIIALIDLRVDQAKNSIAETYQDPILGPAEAFDEMARNFKKPNLIDSKGANRFYRALADQAQEQVGDEPTLRQSFELMISAMLIPDDEIEIPPIPEELLEYRPYPRLVKPSDRPVKPTTWTIPNPFDLPFLRSVNEKVAIRKRIRQRMAAALSTASNPDINIFVASFEDRVNFQQDDLSNPQILSFYATLLDHVGLEGVFASVVLDRSSNTAKDLE